jgi:glycosyltransferase involved in cell wall biosynthesis
MNKELSDIAHKKQSEYSDTTCLLSFVIPMYNCEAYIGECISSITSQLDNSDTFEIIVIDDGSKDNGYKVVSGLQNKYKNLRLIHQQNAGQSVARNKGLKIATGKYIFFVDGDDLLVENSLQNVLNLLTLYDFEILSFEISSERRNSDFAIKSIDTGINTFAKFNLNNSACAAIFRKEFLIRHKIEFVSGRLSEDAMFTIDAFLKAQVVYKIDADVYQYIRHPNTTTTNKTYNHMMKYIDDFMFVVEYITKRIYENVDAMNKQSFRAFCLRRDSFIFFLLMRMLHAKLKHSQVKTYVRKLKALNVYPFPSLLPDYPGIKMRILERIANTPLLYYLACQIYIISR